MVSQYTIVTDDLDFSADELLEYAFPKVLKQNSGKLPVNKYLKNADMDFPECVELSKKLNFDNIISETIKRSRKCLGEYKSVKEIWDQEKNSLERATRLISHLEEMQIDVDELEKVLKRLFEPDDSDGN
ncbi:hypothetical protein [Sedimentibacter sp.]|uniref:hypothetical protein n=1 Tax=Sedimentibacter sp. TaxID=1960295 RepID=UPI00289B1171|nr:hypothetical protein [Sedimentibacter sp.]